MRDVVGPGRYCAFIPGAYVQMVFALETDEINVRGVGESGGRRKPTENGCHRLHFLRSPVSLRGAFTSINSGG